MTQIEHHAIRDAEIGYEEHQRSAADWLAITASVRRGDNAGPAVEVIAEVGRDTLCHAWGVDPDEWDQHSGAWLRSYNLMWCSTIEVLVGRSKGAA